MAAYLCSPPCRCCMVGAWSAIFPTIIASALLGVIVGMVVIVGKPITVGFIDNWLWSAYGRQMVGIFAFCGIRRPCRPCRPYTVRVVILHFPERASAFCRALQYGQRPDFSAVARFSRNSCAARRLSLVVGRRGIAPVPRPPAL